METAPWYYVSPDRQRQGPVPAGTIRDLFAAGTLNSRSLVWQQGMPQWQALEQVADALGVRVDTPAPPPSPPAPSDPTPVAFATGADAPGPARAPVRPDAYPDAAMQQAYAAHVGVDPQARPLFNDGPVVYARFLKRVAASLVDGFIVAMIALVVQMPIALIAGVSSVGVLDTLGGEPSDGSLLLELLVQAVGIAVGLAYFGYFYTSAQQASPGKLLVGIKLVRPDGETISFARSAGRYFANWLNAFTLGLTYLLPLITTKRQALHDLVADTVVVDRWAFTESPERQSEALGGCAIAVLVLFALAVGGGALFAIIGVAAFASAMGA